MFPLAKLFNVGLLLVAASGLASAAQFTDAHEEGVYFITQSETGEDVFERLDVSLAVPAGLGPAPPRVRARYSYLPRDTYAKCDGLAVDEQDFYGQAYDKFWFWCSNHGDKLGKGIYAVKTSDTAVFMCNTTPNPCNVNEFWEAIDTIGKNCKSRNLNWISGGWVQINSWHKSYGFTDVHSKFCE